MKLTKRLKNADTGKTLKKLEKKPTKKLGKKAEKWVGANYKLVGLEVTGEGHPKVSRYVPPGTMRKINNDGARSSVFMTIMPGGLRVAWDTCGACMEWTGNCRCNAGVSAPRSIEYIYDQTVALQAGEEWTPHHPRYRVGSIQAMRSNSKTGRLAMGTTSGNTSEGKKLLTKGKTLTKPVKPMAEEALDTAKLHKAAKKMADSSTKSLNKKLRKLEGGGKSITTLRKKKLRK